VIRHKGRVNHSDLIAAREAGVDDSLMVEIVTTVTLNTFTNYNNRLAATGFIKSIIQSDLIALNE
jgi:hypothetical protein